MRSCVPRPRPGRMSVRRAVPALGAACLLFGTWGAGRAHGGVTDAAVEARIRELTKALVDLISRGFLVLVFLFFLLSGFFTATREKDKLTNTTTDRQISELLDCFRCLRDRQIGCIDNISGGNPVKGSFPCSWIMPIERNRGGS